MKKLFLLVLLSVSFAVATAQPIVKRASAANTVVDARLGAERNLFIPRYNDTTAANLDAGIDSCGAIIFTYDVNNIWVRACSPKRWVKGSSDAVASANKGLSINDDKVVLGNLVWTETANQLDKPRFISVKSRLALDAPRSPFIISNRMTVDSMIADIPMDSIQGATYGSTVFHINSHYKEEWGDTLTLQYGGLMSLYMRRVWDSASTRFRYDAKDVWFDEASIDIHQQYFPPRDSTRVRVVPDGASGSAIRAALDIGASWGYDMEVYHPGYGYTFPLTTFYSVIDLQRENSANAQRNKQLTGAGVAGYTASWKNIQHNIGPASPELGWYTSRIVDFYSFGTTRPNNTIGTTKAKMLAVSTVDTAVGFYSLGKWTAGNEVLNGYGFVAKGDSDFNYMQGFLRLGYVMPTRQSSRPLARFENYGTTYLTDTLRHTQSLTVADSSGMYIMVKDRSSNIIKYVLPENLPFSGGSMSLTINSTSISSGTAGRLLYENSSNQLSETSVLSFDAANSRLIIDNGSNSITAGVDAIIFADAGTGSYNAEFTGNGDYTGFLVSNKKSDGSGIPFVQYFNEFNNKYWTSQLEANSSFSIREGGAAATQRLNISEGGDFVFTSDAGGYQFANLTQHNDTTNYKVMVSDASGNIHYSNWLYAGGGSGQNFANADLTADGNRTHDFADFSLTINDASAYSFNSVDGGSRGALLISPAESAANSFHLYTVDSSGTIVKNGVYGVGANTSIYSITDSDSTVITTSFDQMRFRTSNGNYRFENVGMNNDTSTYKIVVMDASGNIKRSNWISGGGSSISFGTDNQIPFMNSDGDDFDYSSNLIFDGDKLTVTSGAAAGESLNTLTIVTGEANATSMLRLQGTGLRSAYMGLGASDHVYIKNQHSTNAGAGIVFQNRLSATLASFTNAVAHLPFSVIINEAGGDFDVRIEGDGDANLFFTDAGNDRVGIGTNSPSAKLHIVSTTEQQRIAYDGSNYMAITISSTGSATFDLTGTSPTFTFSDPVIARIRPRIGTTTTGSSITPNGDANDQYTITALSENTTINAPSGTPTDGQKLIIRITADSTPRTLTWDAIYRESTDISLPTETVSEETIYLQFIYNSANSTWDLVGLTGGFS